MLHECQVLHATIHFSGSQMAKWMHSFDELQDDDSFSDGSMITVGGEEDTPDAVYEVLVGELSQTDFQVRALCDTSSHPRSSHAV